MSLHKLRLAAVPVTFSTFSSRLFLKPFHNTLTLGSFSRHVQPRKPLLLRAFSASAVVHDIPTTQTSDSSGIHRVTLFVHQFIIVMNIADSFRLLRVFSCE